MSKQITNRFIFLLLISFFVSGALSGLTAAGHALIVGVKGSAKVEQSGKTKAARKDMLVKTGAVVRTAKKAFVMIQLSKTLIVRVGESTVVTLSELKEGGNGQLTLSKGSVGAKVDSSTKHKFSVATPTATASVRGTEFIVETPEENPEEEATVLVNEGEVAVEDEAGNSAAVGEGSKAEVSAEGLKTSIMEEFEKQKFEIFAEFEKLKKLNYEAFVEQLRRNEELREQMRNR